MARQRAAYLFVPGNRPERFDKACFAAPGMVIIDLEDAVPPEQKDIARNALAAWLRPGADIVVRINGYGSPWFDDDLRLAAAAGIRAVMLPKAESADVVAGIAVCNRPVIALIETARGVAQARELARQPGVERLAFGSIDLKVDLGITGDDDALDYFRSELVLASRLAQIGAPIDGVTTATDDLELLRRDSERARRFGFGAKLCIHPSQIGPVEASFAPSVQDVAWARRIVDAVAASNGAAVSVDGKMVDKPVVAMATRILDAT